jgi:hypothetical protein
METANFKLQQHLLKDVLSLMDQYALNAQKAIISMIKIFVS